MIAKRSQNQINCLTKVFFFVFYYQASLLPYFKEGRLGLAEAVAEAVASVNTIPGHRNNTQLIKLNKWDRHSRRTQRRDSWGALGRKREGRQHFKGFQFHKANDVGDDKTRLTRSPVARASLLFSLYLKLIVCSCG